MTRTLALVDSGEFDRLFIQHLGWNSPTQPPLTVTDPFGNTHTVTQVATFKGMGIWTCPTIPDLTAQRHIDAAVAAKTLERLIIYTDGIQQEWRWPRSSSRKRSGPPTLVPHRHTVGQPNPALVERLGLIEIPMGSEITVPELLDKMREAFDREAETASKQAARLMGGLYEKLEAAGMGEQESSIFLARLLFLMFGDDTNMWKRNLFHDFIAEHADADGANLRERLLEAFDAADTDKKNRPKDLNPGLRDLPYINGGIFSDELCMPDLDGDFRKALLETCRFDWGQISPAVFGSMFQTVKTKEARRHLGEHYTTEENILKTIEPLFLDELRERLEAAWDDRKALTKLHNELGEMRFLDPACGCGNFLIVAYRELRALELALMIRKRDLAVAAGDKRAMQLAVDATHGLKVSIEQFYGIEIEAWPARIAETAMFLIDHQANLRMDHELGTAPTRLPLEVSPHIHLGNALRMNWGSVIPASHDTYIFGNPPFLGSRLQSVLQKEDRLEVWGSTPKSATLDYVCNWFLLAARYLQWAKGKAAFVATNSISQGEQPAVLWSMLYELGCDIDFAHQPFDWSNDAQGAAAVDVVIIGFSRSKTEPPLKLWCYPSTSNKSHLEYVPRINAYLMDAPKLLVSAARMPLGGAPRLHSGSVPRDGGWLSRIDQAEASEIRQTDAIAAKYLRRLYGAEELIQGVERWCLWLAEADPDDLRSSQVIRSRLEECLAERAGKPGSKGRAAATPELFADMHQPGRRFLCVPSVSSENRSYLPTAYLEPTDIINNAVFSIRDEDEFWFGLVSSQLFIRWVKAVSSRLESRIQIGAGPVYNTFPFRRAADSDRKEIRAAAKEVLIARSDEGAMSLAELYDPSSMPVGLKEAHARLDVAVNLFFGLPEQCESSTALGHLFELYAEATSSSQDRLPLP